MVSINELRADVSRLRDDRGSAAATCVTECAVVLRGWHQVCMLRDGMLRRLLFEVASTAVSCAGRMPNDGGRLSVRSVHGFGRASGFRVPRPTGSDTQRRALRMEVFAVRVLCLDTLVTELLVKRVSSIANDVPAQ